MRTSRSSTEGSTGSLAQAGAAAARPGGQGGKGRGGGMREPGGNMAAGGKTTRGVWRARKLGKEGCPGWDLTGVLVGIHLLHSLAAHLVHSQSKTEELRLKMMEQAVHRSVALPE